MKPSPHEDILRHLWSKQYFDTEHLSTTDGSALRILSPGRLHRGSGPDFRDAIIVLDGTTYRGDIEFHRTLEDWNSHRHSGNRNYNSVILHVVLLRQKDGGHGDSITAPTLSASGRTIPLLILEPFLTSPLETILEHTSRDEAVSRSAAIYCAYNERRVSSVIAEQWLRKLFMERVRKKTTRLRIRLVEIIEEHQRAIAEPKEEYGTVPLEGNPDEIPVPDFCFEKGMLNKILIWEQLLYEELMDGLGYSQNRTAFKKLSKIVPLWKLKRHAFAGEPLSLLDLQAILFNAAGLLPLLSETNNQPAKIYVHQLQTVWQAINFSPDEILNPTEWTFSPTRPSNFPTIRIAAASALIYELLYGQLFKKIILAFSTETFSADNAGMVLDSLLTIHDDGFWSVHYSFNETTPLAHSLLGKSRRMDIAINGIVPLCLLYAETFGKRDIDTNALRFALTIGAHEENSILRKMKKQLPVESLDISRAYQQQGTIQLYKKYCQVLRCGECTIGAAVLTN
jgi:hypothetical protein